MTLELYMERSYFSAKDSLIFLFGIKGENTVKLPLPSTSFVLGKH